MSNHPPTDQAHRMKPAHPETNGDRAAATAATDTDADGQDEVAALRERVAELEETVELLTSVLEVRAKDDSNTPLTPTLEDIWLAGEPAGKILSKTKQRSYKNEQRIDELDATVQANVTNRPVSTLDEMVRAELMPAHKMWMDVREGFGDQLDESPRRAATIFGAFIRRACGEGTKVDASGQKYSLTSTAAKTLLQESEYTDGTMYSQTVRRVFEQLQQLSKTESCECSSIGACGHGLLIFDDSGGTNVVGVNKARFHDYLETVEAAVKAGETPPTTDDPERAGEAPTDAEHARATLDELEAASVPETDPANTVVSRVDDPALDGGDAN